MRKSVSQAECFWSGRPGSNRRHLPWQGITLPLSYSRSHMLKYSGPANPWSTLAAAFLTTSLCGLKRNARTSHQILASPHDMRRHYDDKLTRVLLHIILERRLESRQFAEPRNPGHRGCFAFAYVAHQQRALSIRDREVRGKLTVFQHGNAVCGTAPESFNLEIKQQVDPSRILNDWRRLQRHAEVFVRDLWNGRAGPAGELLQQASDVYAVRSE